MLLRAAVGLGALALWLLAAIVVVGLCLPVYVHSTSIGSETRFSLLEWVYLFYGVSFVVLLAAHLWYRLAGRRKARRALCETSVAAP